MAEITLNVNNTYSKGDSYFDGGLFQLIGWSILGTIVTIITFGIWIVNSKLNNFLKGVSFIFYRCHVV